jgi:hypothetical protein
VSNLFASLTFRVLFALSVFVMLLLVPTTYWAIDKQPPYTFIQEGSYIIPNTAVGNDQMIVSWQVIVNRQCEGSVRRELFDPHTKVILAMYAAEAAHKNAMPRGLGSFNKTFLLPRQIQPGRIGYRARLEYYCNPLQRIWPITYSTPDLFFEVKQ